MLLKSVKKKWFTLVEVLLVCSIFAIMVTWIILAVNRSYTFMNNTKLQIQATNLAREWVEMMFNIRDTNRRKCSWQKDQFWLYLGSGASASNEKECNLWSDEYKFKQWIYSINEGENWQGDAYIYAKNLNITNMDFYSTDWFWKDAFSSARLNSKLLFDGSYYYRSWSTKEWSMQDLLWREVDFYRVVRVYGLYCKSVWSSDQVVNNTFCKNGSDPKELRFCVKVFYRLGNWNHDSELCSIMTNFEE